MMPRTLPPIPSMAMLKPFEIRDGVTVASIHVRGPLSKESYDGLLATGGTETGKVILYLHSVQQHVMRNSGL